jgi:hypothetical protein
LAPVTLGGTFAVSFLTSVESGAIAGITGDAGVVDARAIAGPGGFGASGGTPASDAGFDSVGGGTPTTEGGFGGGTIPGPPAEAGVDGAAMIGGDPIAEGGLGATGAIPGVEGGLGTADGVAGPATAKIPGGLGGWDAVGAGWAEMDPGVLGFWTGFGGRFIIAVSRGPDDKGWPSRRGGRTMRTVSFLGSDI